MERTSYHSGVKLETEESLRKKIHSAVPKKCVQIHQSQRLTCSEIPLQISNISDDHGNTTGLAPAGTV